MKRLPLLLCLAATVSPLPAIAQSAGGEAVPGPEFTMQGHVNKFAQLPPDIARLQLPEGFTAGIAAEGLGNARMLAVHANGTVYVTRRAEGDVLMLRDADNDGRYEMRRTVASRPDMHGIAIHNDTAYLVTVKDVYAAPIAADGSFGPLALVVDDLPDAGQHPNRTIAMGSDGMLYVSAGSTCNACGESNPENATIVRMKPDGSERMIYASGLRNTIGFDWNPRTGELWGLDHGIDWLGDERQPEELNRIREGARYGWPYIFGAGEENPQDQPPAGLTMADWRTMSEPMVLGHTAHAAPMQMAFNTGTGFPSAMQGDAFAAFRGSWNRAEPSGYEVVRIRFDRAGRPQAMEPFVTGFIQDARQGGKGWTGRPTGLAFTPAGDMLVTDPENGVLYRIAYTGRKAGSPLARTGASAAEERPAPLAADRPAMRARGALAVRSDAFVADGMMPDRFSAWHQDVSPPLSWSEGPQGTRSYALIMEDPDAGTPAPVLHWTAWNIPAGTTMLREGLPGSVQLTDPAGMRQGANRRGSTGYFGPRPPVGDPPHRYHVQVFALDRTLDLLPGAGRDDLLQAMQGHVLAKGTLVGTFAQPQPPAKR